MKAVAGGRRSGKTSSAAHELVKQAYVSLETPRPSGRPEAEATIEGKMVRPRRHVWVVAPTYKLLAEPFRALHDAVPTELLDEYRADSNPPHIWLRGGILIEGYGADRPERLVGVGLDGVWLDEAASMKPQVWLEKLRPTLTEHRGFALFSTTPEGHNWFYENVWQQRHSYARFHWLTVDNTAIPGMADEVAQARSELPPRLFRRQYEASFEAFVGQIYEEWDESIHVFDGPIDGRKYRKAIAGVDWGYATAGAVAVGGVGADGCIDIIAEEIASRRSPPEWQRAYTELRNQWHVGLWVCDPSQPASLEWLRGVGPAIGARNDVTAGINAVTALLYQRRLRVHRSCSELIATLPTYRWRESQGYGVMEEPAPGQNDHVLDALRYLVMSEAEGPSMWTLGR